MIQNQEQQYEYQLGGSLKFNAPSYVVRQADSDLYESLLQGKFCYVFNSRQMGKSSLRVRIKHLLQAQGFSCVSLDLSRLGSENLTSVQWYKGIVSELWRGLGLMGQVNLISWYRSLEELSPVCQLSRFIEDILLLKIPNRIFIFIDEIDSVKSLKFPTDDFFAFIRFCYNQRCENPAYNRLSFALFGVATPGELIADRERTPFNIGKAIELRGFEFPEVTPLIRGLEEKIDNPRVVIKEILHWTGGQPFLTQKLCQLVTEQKSANSQSSRQTFGESPFLNRLLREVLVHHSELSVQISTLVQSQIIEDWESHDEPEHLKTIRERLLRDKERAIFLLELYGQILQQGSLPADNSTEQLDLLLSGLVVKQEGQLRVYNRIYEAVFNQSWINRKISKLQFSRTFWVKKGVGLSLHKGEVDTDAICAALISHLDYLSDAQIQTVKQAIAEHLGVRRRGARLAP
jgi:hypothetical protein